MTPDDLKLINKIYARLEVIRLWVAPERWRATAATQQAIERNAQQAIAVINELENRSKSRK